MMSREERKEELWEVKEALKYRNLIPSKTMLLRQDEEEY